MGKIFALVILSSMASFALNGPTKLVVDCKPAPMNGGAAIYLKGTLNLIVSPTTGAIKVKAGETLELKVNTKASVKIPVTGMYLENPSGTYKTLDASVDSDDREFSSIFIDFNDQKNSMRSFIQNLSGKKFNLNCGK